MTKTPAQLEREIAEHLASPPLVSENTGQRYDRVYDSNVANISNGRWIGRCKKCGATHNLEGRLTVATASGRNSDYVIVTHDGRIYTMAHHGSDTSHVTIPCGDHWCTLRRVVEGTKKSKHECGARCTNATGPNCDCKCRGRMHGSNC
jgi:hypothetical protein